MDLLASTGIRAILAPEEFPVNQLGISINIGDRSAGGQRWLDYNEVSTFMHRFNVFPDISCIFPFPRNAR